MIAMKQSAALERKRLLKDEVKRIVGILRKEYKPQKIILFGSLVKGRVHAWSDIDLLVVKDTAKRPIDRCMEICRMVQPNVGVDLFVYTPEEYTSLVEDRFSIVMNALKEGRVLYEKRDGRVAESQVTSYRS
jgi:predicted nucleotidyltransferase